MTEIEFPKNSNSELIELNDENSQKENSKDKKEVNELKTKEKNQNN